VIFVEDVLILSRQENDQEAASLTCLSTVPGYTLVTVQGIVRLETMILRV